ncbi:MAG TPA: TadE family type IV pilus minor pilin [Streptosporangiaceae bacterium]|nr:TadE family type IV pilus minor pilin [Streptosporangiaceae bacterium]
MRRPSGPFSATSERGSATVEIAVALPALVFVIATALWGVSVAAAHVACVDAARAGARAAARGEPIPAVRAAALRAAPSGARVAAHRDGDLAEVDVTVTVRAPGLSGLPPAIVHERAVAATEPGVAEQAPPFAVQPRRSMPWVHGAPLARVVGWVGQRSAGRGRDSGGAGDGLERQCGLVRPAACQGRATT